MVKYSETSLLLGRERVLVWWWTFLGTFLGKFLGTFLGRFLRRGGARKVVGVRGGETLQDFRPILQLTTYLVEAPQKEEVFS